MRKVIVSNMVSLDGFIGGRGGEIDWHTVNNEFFEQTNDMLASADTFLFGRVTYEGMRDYWTSADAITNDAAIAEKMNTTPKIVFSKTLDTVTWGKWNNARLVKDRIGEAVAEVKRQPGQDILIFGSGQIVSLLTQLGLIDEYRLFVNPVILGGGLSQFAGVSERVKLKLLQTQAYSTGVVLLLYAPVRA